MNTVDRAAVWSGWALSPAAHEKLLAYGDWLKTEAMPAGGIGPNEAPRIENRHLADSLLFAGAWKKPSPPKTLTDLGSGVGLPGIPLAILWPTTRVTLVDRAGRRTELAKRAGRVLGLTNLDVITADAGEVDKQTDMVVARATADAKAVFGWAKNVVLPGGIVVVGGSRVERPEAVAGERILEVPADILDRPVWLRIMEKS